MAVRAKSYRARNPDKVSATNNTWRENNRDRHIETRKAWRLANLESQRRKRREKYRANRERELAVGRKYKAENKSAVAAQMAARIKAFPEKNRMARSIRRASEKKAMPSWASRKKMMVFYSEAVRLTRETGLEHHVDHIVPLQSKIVCGLHWEGNLQILTASANHSKSNRTWPDAP